MGVTDLQNCNTTLYITPSTTLIMKTTEVYGNSVRHERGLELLKEGNVILDSKNPLRAVVKGSEQQYYQVNISAQKCECKDHKFNPHLICKHIKAAEIAYKILTGEIVVPYEVKN